MDAPAWTGDDNRDELSPDPDEGRCVSCGAAEDEPCAPLCDCAHCLRVRALALRETE